MQTAWRAAGDMHSFTRALVLLARSVQRLNVGIRFIWFEKSRLDSIRSKVLQPSIKRNNPPQTSLWLGPFENNNENNIPLLQLHTCTCSVRPASSWGPMTSCFLVSLSWIFFFYQSSLQTTHKVKRTTSECFNSGFLFCGKIIQN